MDNWLEIVGTIVGLVYLYLEYKASIYLWIASVIMPAIYLVVFYDAGLYADTAINIYYLIIALYGWFAWRYGSEQKSELTITHASTKVWVAMAATYIVAQLLFSAVLIYLTDSDVPLFNGGKELIRWATDSEQCFKKQFRLSTFTGTVKTFDNNKFAHIIHQLLYF